jgi:EpsD family peptidyl-prolyl cis-trans isomerase
MRIAALLVAVFPVALPVLWSCGKPVPRSEVAATVNGSEIALAQLRRAVAASVAAPGAKPTPAQLVDAMIDEELLAQKALDLKLERQPQVRAAIEAMRTRILAQSYMQLLATSEKEDPAKVRAFYRANPALFEQRRIYRLFELIITAPPLERAALRARVSKAKTLSEVSDWLKSRNIEFALGAATKAAEEIPLQLLPSLAAMQDGQIALIDGAGAISVIQLVQSQSAPLSEAQALPLIEQFLRAPEFTKLVAAQLKRLRDSADIEYLLDVGPAAASLLGL